jgi:hypothetical protein
VVPRPQVKPYFRPQTPVEVRRSAVRRVVATTRMPASGAETASDGPAIPPDVSRFLRDVTLLDGAIGVGDAQFERRRSTPSRLADGDIVALTLLDRLGLVPASLLTAGAYPDLAPRTARWRLARLHDEGLVARHQVSFREQPRGGRPVVYSLTALGFSLAQRDGRSEIPQDRAWRRPATGRRLAHDMHAFAWLLGLHRQLGAHVTGDWATPVYRSGQLYPPTRGHGHNAKKIGKFDIPAGERIGIFDIPVDEFGTIFPDVRTEVSIPSRGLAFDVLVEMDRTGRPAYNEEKLRQYDAFLLGWSLLLDRYKEHLGGNRPIVIFVCPDHRRALALAERADRLMTAHLGVIGSPPATHYYAGREHTLFAVESDIHHGSPAVIALDPLPPAVRAEVSGTTRPLLHRRALLPASVLEAGHSKADAHG